MIVKICGITNREDALAAIEGGAAALGFNFWPRSPRYVAPRLAAEIGAALPASVWKVGVFVNEPLAAEIAREIGLDIVQLHGDETPAAYPAGFRVWKAARVEAGFDLAAWDACPAEALLLDGPAGALYGGAGAAFDWNLARGAKKIVLAGGLDASNVRAAIEQAHPWGVDACSRIEAAPGRKDHRRMAAFLKAALETI
ncbi:MAG TPA: phosphoribosylanthranilate isomerase [Bryobacteraceae bacterium]|nr:phosphoribosylanthranilate isomerase [Bryobacteraceae bacterium]